MPDYNRPEDFASIINDLQRRVRVLERAARVLPTNAVIPELVPTNFAAAQSLEEFVRPVAYDATARTSAVRVSDAVTVDLPSITVSASMVLVVYSVRWTNVRPEPQWYSDYIEIGLRLDGTPLSYPWLAELEPGDQNPLHMVGTFELDGASHQFQVDWAATANPDASSPSFHAQLGTQSLAAIPIKL